MRRHTRCPLVTAVQTCALAIPGDAQRADHHPSLARQPLHPARRAEVRALEFGFPEAARRTIEQVHAGLGKRLDEIGELVCRPGEARAIILLFPLRDTEHDGEVGRGRGAARSEEHTSELQSLMRISYAVFCLKKKKSKKKHINKRNNTL